MPSASCRTRARRRRCLESCAGPQHFGAGLRRSRPGASAGQSVLPALLAQLAHSMPSRQRHRHGATRGFMQLLMRSLLVERLVDAPIKPPTAAHTLRTRQRNAAPHDHVIRHGAVAGRLCARARRPESGRSDLAVDRCGRRSASRSETRAAVLRRRASGTSGVRWANARSRCCCTTSMRSGKAAFLTIDAAATERAWLRCAPPPHRAGQDRASRHHDRHRGSDARVREQGDLAVEVMAIGLRKFPHQHPTASGC